MGKLARSAPTTSGRVYSCRLAEIIANAEDDDDRAAINDRMHSVDHQGHYVYSGRIVANWLGVSEGVIQKHRGGKTCRTCGNG